MRLFAAALLALTLWAFPVFAQRATESPRGDVRDQLYEGLSASLEQEPDNLDARYQYSALKVMQGEYQEAMDNLLEIIRRDRGYRDDIGRRALVDVFQLLGNEGPLVKKYRGKLSSVLN